MRLVLRGAVTVVLIGQIHLVPLGIIKATRGEPMRSVPLGVATAHPVVLMPLVPHAAIEGSVVALK